MSLKITETFKFGGVDSRSNALNMPQNRGLRVRNFLLTKDGHIRLRDGFTDQGASIGAGAVHSQIGYKLLNGDRYALFAQGLHLYRKNLQTGVVDEPTVKGKALSGTGTWSWYLAFNRLHGTNGVDQKFFDGTVWRDIGIRALTSNDVFGVVLTEGVREISSTEATAVAISSSSTGGIFTNTSGAGLLFYLAYFDTAADEIGPSTISVGAGRVTLAGGTSTQSVSFTGLPNLSAINANWLKLVARTGDGDNQASFCVDTAAPIVSAARVGSVVTVNSPSHGRSPGDILSLSGQSESAYNGVFTVRTVIDADHFTFTKSMGGNSTGGVWSHVIAIANAATTASITSSARDTDGNLNPSGLIVNGDRGLSASSVGGAQPGFQFYAAIYNPSTGHVGNRVKIAKRFVPTERCNVHFAGLPNLSATDSEWELIIGRTSDGAEVPYAVTDLNGSWVTVPSGSVTAIVTMSGIDGAAELPTRNTPPPAALSKVARVGDYVYGIVSDGPWVYRTPVGVDAIDSYIPDASYPSIGRAEQSWPANNLLTFPTGAIPSGNHGYSGDCWVQSLEDLAILVDQQGTPGWQGPWPGMGIAGQDAFSPGWKGLPYWVTGHKQLATMNSDGPVPISDEYEAALLAQIGDVYLSQTQVVPYRDTDKQLEMLLIKGRDVNGNPFLVIHDFNARDDRSPYGQAVDCVYGGPLATDFYLQTLRDQNSRQRIWAGASDGHLYQLFDGLTDAGDESALIGDMILLPYIGPDRTAVPIIEWYGDKNVEWYVSTTLDKSINDLSKFTALRGPDDEAETVSGDESNPHYMVRNDDPEMIHAYLWIRLRSHAADAPANGMGLNNPPHMGLEVYGRILAVSPLVGTSRGK